MKYRKKPVVVEAIQFRGDSNKYEVAEFFKGSGPFTVGFIWDDLTHTTVGLSIQTLEGVMRANVGDYIIKGIKGEFYPCKADIFEKTYELVI